MRRMALTIGVLLWAMCGFALAQDGVYGDHLDGPEEQAMAETFQYALENNKTNQASAWVNPDTGRSGTLVPVRTYQTSTGRYCREYITTVIIAGEEQQAYGTACRQPDGTWQIASNESRPATSTVVQKNYYVYPYGYADWYDRYPYYPWNYYYPRIFFSFDIVHFHGHRHYQGYPYYYGHRFHGSKHFHGGKRFDGGGYYHGGKRHHDGQPRFHGQRNFHKDFRGGGHFKGGHRFDGNRHFRGGEGGRRGHGGGGHRR